MPDESPIEIGAIELTAEPPSDEGGQPEEQSRSRSRVRQILLGSLLTVAVAGGGVLAYTGWQVATQKDAKLGTPARVGSLTLDTSEDARSTADYLQTAVAAEIDLDNTIGAVYQDSASPQEDVLIFGGTTLFWAPENNLDAAFDLVADNEGSVTGLHKVDAGKLGGVMKCGSTKTDTDNLTVCGWADHGSLALALFNNRSESEAAVLLRQIRDAAETR